MNMRINFYYFLLLIPSGAVWSQGNTAGQGTSTTQGSPAAAQNSIPTRDPHHFLWFTGHWNPSKKNVFIIDKDGSSGSSGNGASQPGSASPGYGSATPSPGVGPTGTGGGTVTLEPDGSVQMQGGSADGWNKRIDGTLKQLGEWDRQLNDPAGNMDLTNHHLYLALQPDAEAMKQQWSDYKIDPKQDILSPATQPPGNASANSPGTGGASSPDGAGTAGAPARPPAGRTMNDLISSLCNESKAKYDEVIKFYKAHRKYDDGDLNVPPPPEFEYNCYACDSNMRKIYDTTIAHYLRDFLHPEDSLLRSGLEILHQLALVGMENGTYTGDAAEVFGKGGACNYLSPDDLSQAVQGIMMHLLWRAEKLVKKFRSHYKAAEAIARTYLTVDRQWLLLGGSDGGLDGTLGELAYMVSQNFDFYYQKLKTNDWRQVGNLTYEIGLARQISLLGSNSGDYQFSNYMDRLLRIMNGFTLSVEMDIKIGKDQGYRLSHLKGECKVGPDFVRDSDQCYKWVVLDENLPDILGFYRPKALQQIDCNLLANELVMPPQAPRMTYIGTKKYTAGLIGLRMDFCNPGKDTVILTNFSPNPTNNGLWQIPYSPSQNMGVTGENFFEDENARKRLAESGQAQKAADDYQQKSQALVAQMKAAAQQMKSGQSNGSANNFQKIQELQAKIQGLSTNSALAQMLYIDFELPVQNNAQVLVDKRFEAKQINPELAEAVIYGYYTVHIENNGNAKSQNKGNATTQSNNNAIKK